MLPHRRLGSAGLFTMLGLIHGIGTTASAAPPQINKIAPLGVRRGVASEVTISGGSLAANPRLIAPFPFQIDPLSASGQERRGQLENQAERGRRRRRRGLSCPNSNR